MKTLNDDKKFSKLRMLLIFLTFAIVYGAPNYTQYQLSPLSTVIMEQFNLNYVQYNSIFSAPMLPAIFTSIIIGWLVDRYGYKSVIGLSIFLTCLGAWIRLFAESYAAMYIGMILVGFSAGVLASNSSKVLSQLYGAERVSVVMGIVLSISTLGLVLSMSTTTMLGSIKTAFLVAAVICTVGLIMWIVFMPRIRGNDSGDASDVQPAEAPSLGAALSVVVKNKYVWFTGLFMFCVCGAMTGTGSMIPAALMEVRGFSSEAAGMIGSLMMVGNLLGSLFTPTICLKTGKLRAVLMICGAISVLGCCFAWRAPEGIPMYIAMILTGYAFGSGMSQGIAMAIRLPGVGAVYAGTAGGMIATLHLLGGVVLPTYIASAVAGSNYSIYFIIIGVSSLLWILAIYLLPKQLDVKG